jgi:hypothetical protein
LQLRDEIRTLSQDNALLKSRLFDATEAERKLRSLGSSSFSSSSSSASAEKEISSLREALAKKVHLFFALPPCLLGTFPHLLSLCYFRRKKTENYKIFVTS